jgi:leader peptidase (prepilin peptidase)/N-methyltransferase
LRRAVTAASGRNAASNSWPAPIWPVCRDDREHDAAPKASARPQVSRERVSFIDRLRINDWQSSTSGLQLQAGATASGEVPCYLAAVDVVDVFPELGSPALRAVAIMGAAAFGAIWGSFLNVCIARVPLGQSVVRPGSHCFACGRPVRPYDNIPILSYFLLRGRCRDCGARFSPRYAAVEALMAALSALLLRSFVLDFPGLPVGLRVARYATYFAFTAVLVVLTFIDLDTKRLPDVITLPSVIVFYLAGFAIDGPSWSARLIGAAGGYLVVRIVADVYYYSTGREGLGLGDGKLLAFMGALLGWKALPPIMFCASFVGIVVSVPVLLVRRRKDLAANPDTSAQAPASEPIAPEPASIRRAEVPFGPFLALSALGYVFLREPAWAWLSRFLVD